MIKDPNNAVASRRGGTVTARRTTGHRVAMSTSVSTRPVARHAGFTLIELVMTLTVMAILAMGAIPLLKLSVKRQKEQQLRANLRAIRSAIDEFHRDTVGMQCTGTTASAGGVGGGGTPIFDPRSKVTISDCTI